LRIPGATICSRSPRVGIFFSYFPALEGSPGSRRVRGKKTKGGREAAAGGGAEGSYAHSFSQLKTDPAAGNVRGLEQAPNG